MKKFVKPLALMLALLMVLLTLSACSSGTQTPASEAEAPAAAEPAETPSDTPAEAVSEPAPVEITPASTEFVPQLDTEKEVELNAAVFFDNFPALDQVINHFNEFYPNVIITYNQVSDTSSEEFLQDNDTVDIFMTSPERGYPVDSCADLLAAGVDFSAVADGMLSASTFDGKVLSLPMGLTLKGLVVNKTLLANEGLTVPQTWQEFLDTLETLKQKGYTPLQGPTGLFTQIAYSMGMSMLGSDPALLNAVTTGDKEGASALLAVYDRLYTLYEKGYFSEEVNAEYPENNYDGAIMKFFEGDVPFWVCDTEKVSGMKKRESKSEAYSANPFEYEFIFAPLGDNGVYEYIEPWYGFSVNKDSSSYDYAIEFLRFMARDDELNTLASVKGIPSVTREASLDQYASLGHVEKVELSVVSDSTVPVYYGTLLCHAANDTLFTDQSSADTALETFLNNIAASLSE